MGSLYGRRREITSMKLTIDMVYRKQSKDERIAELKASLAAARAEVERLRGIIREAEWSDMTMVDNRPYLFAPACPICEVEKGNEHGDYCSFYQWEGDVL